MARSGGRCQPVNPGEMSRLTHPAGVMRNASPIATATCGVASSGARMTWVRRNRRVACIALQKPMTIVSARTVASNPLWTVRCTDVQNPGVASRRCQGALPT